MHRRERTAVIRSNDGGRFDYSSRLVTLLLIALVGVVALFLFTAAPVFTR